MSYRKHLLLVEDEEAVAHAVQTQAQASGYRLHIEGDALSGYRTAEREKPDLILIDVTLPDLNGLDLCKKIRQISSLRSVPLILLNQEPTELDIILGLELGADDYLIKPLSLPLLFARIKTLLRRCSTQDKPLRSLYFGPFTLEIDRHLLLKENQVVPLTRSEFGILRRLLSQKGKTHSRSDLLRECHNWDPFIVDRNIDVHIASLRKKLGEAHPYIKTVRGIGYQFCMPASSSKKPTE